MATPYRQTAILPVLQHAYRRTVQSLAADFLSIILSTLLNVLVYPFAEHMLSIPYISTLTPHMQLCRTLKRYWEIKACPIIPPHRFMRAKESVHGERMTSTWTQAHCINLLIRSLVFLVLPMFCMCCSAVLCMYACAVLVYKPSNTKCPHKYSIYGTRALIFLYKYSWYPVQSTNDSGELELLIIHDIQFSKLAESPLDWIINHWPPCPSVCVWLRALMTKCDRHLLDGSDK